jgi:hypothetical protein
MTFHVRYYYTYCDTYSVDAPTPMDADALVGRFAAGTPSEQQALADRVTLIRENDFVDCESGVVEDIATGECWEQGSWEGGRDGGTQ